MPKLTDSQLVVLSAAAQRKDGAVLPLPKSLTINKGAATSVLKSLIKHGLIAERPATREDETWREAEGERLALVITEAGLSAIGVEPDEQSAALATRTDTKPKKPSPTEASRNTGSVPQAAAGAIRTGTKQAMLIDLLSRKAGATIPEIVDATGWQAHSVRGAISGTLKKKLGLPVHSTVENERGRVYRVTGGVGEVAR